MSVPNTEWTLKCEGCEFSLPQGCTDCVACGRPRRQFEGQPYPVADIARFQWLDEQRIGIYKNGKWKGNPTAKHVLSKIVGLDIPARGRAPGRVWIRAIDLAWRTQNGERAVYDALSWLQEHGWLRAMPRRKGGKQDANMYTIQQPEQRIQAAECAVGQAAEYAPYRGTDLGVQSQAIYQHNDQGSGVG